MKQKLLIATTNEGKFREIENFLGSLPFIECVSLKSLNKEISSPEENELTLWGNSLLKAKYYAEKTGLISFADDSGLYINALDGWPGIKSGRLADNDDGRIETVLKKMHGLKNRNATFKNILTIYDPNNDTSFSAYGETKGRILEKPADERKIGFGYDPIFFSEEGQCTFSEMNMQELHQYKHRGKALIKIQYYLQNTYGSKHIVVPFGIILKDKKVLMTLRNDPHNPQFHKKWHFPGGILEFGETMEENIVREVREETGFEVKVKQKINYIAVKEKIINNNLKCQIFLVPFLCSVISEAEEWDDNETLKVKWFKPDEVLKQNLIDGDLKEYTKIMEEVKRIN